MHQVVECMTRIWSVAMAYRCPICIEGIDYVSGVFWTSVGHEYRRYLCCSMGMVLDVWWFGMKIWQFTSGYVKYLAHIQILYASELGYMYTWHAKPVYNRSAVFICAYVPWKQHFWSFLFKFLIYSTYNNKIKWQKAEFLFLGGKNGWNFVIFLSSMLVIV